MRARNIKPSLFANELLSVADPHHAWIFAGLWCMADRRGVLEDRPVTIRMTINPGRDQAKTDDSLAWLEANGFIARYQHQTSTGLVRCIKVLAFGKHQNPHHKEKSSQLPDYVKAPDKPSASPRLAPDQPHTSPADSLLLIPDSLNLIPDPLLPAKAPAETPKGDGRNGSGHGSRPAGLKAPDAYPENLEERRAAILAELQARIEARAKKGDLPPIA